VVTILAVVGVLAVLVAAAFLSTYEEPLLADAPRDAADVPLPDGPLSPEDVAGPRFSLAPRGYRMAEVDVALERLQAELADRDRRIALLEAAAEGTQQPAEVREATPADLPVTATPVAAPVVQQQPVVPPEAPAGEPLPPADLGTSLVTDEAVEPRPHQQ
jgi:DivIVA domain-containing protein